MRERDDSNSGKVLDAVIGLNALRMNNSNGQNPNKAREDLILRGLKTLADLPQEEFRKIVDQLSTNGDK